MSKSTIKKKYATKPTSRRHIMGQARWWLLLIAIFVILLTGVKFFTYPYKKTVTPSSWMATYREHFMRWIANQHPHFQKKWENSKTVKAPAFAKNDAPPRIHFQFYTALPNMHAMMPTTSQSPEAKIPPRPLAAKLATFAPVTDIAELEREVSSHIKSAYVLQRDHTKAMAKKGISGITQFKKRVSE